MPRTMRKGLRDLIVIAASSVLVALSESAGDYGIPVEIAPIVSVAALAAYRFVRDAAQGSEGNV
jgi:predicted SpoU family rRNA methylase